MDFKEPSDRGLAVGEEVFTVVDRASSGERPTVGHACVVTSFRGPTDDRVDVAPVCGAPAGISCDVVPVRMCTRCVAALDRRRVVGVVWEQVETGSGEPERWVRVAV